MSPICKPMMLALGEYHSLAHLERVPGQALAAEPFILFSRFIGTQGV
ncbi:hypothetical protein [Caballeronia sp. M23-90]